MSDTWDYLTGLDNPEGGPTDATVWARLRYRRDALLAASDSRVGPDAPGDVDGWRTYRQALRDLPANTTDPRQAVWPVAPTSTTVGANRAALYARAVAAFNTNRQAIAATNPTNAQVVAQVKKLSAQNNAIMRLLLGLLDGTD